MPFKTDKDDWHPFAASSARKDTKHDATDSLPRQTLVGENMRIRILLLCVLLLAASACCGPAAELVPVYVEKAPVEIVGGYTLGRSSSSGLKLYGKQYSCHDDPKATCYPTIVEQSVVKIGWNQDYIIVERHPREAVIFAKPDARNPTWAIIVVASGAVYGNLSYEELTEHFETLRIPHIGMQDAMAVYK